MDNDPTEYGNDGHMQHCRDIGEASFYDGDSFESCQYKNYDQIEEWKIGWKNAQNLQISSSNS